MPKRAPVATLIGPFKRKTQNVKRERQNAYVLLGHRGTHLNIVINNREIARSWPPRAPARAFKATIIDCILTACANCLGMLIVRNSFSQKSNQLEIKRKSAKSEIKLPCARRFSAPYILHCVERGRPGEFRGLLRTRPFPLAHATTACG